MPTRPLLHGARCAHSTTAAASLPSRALNAPQMPSDEPVPRASTTSWA